MFLKYDWKHKFTDSWQSEPLFKHLCEENNRLTGFFPKGLHILGCITDTRKKLQRPFWFLLGYLNSSLTTQRLRFHYPRPILLRVRSTTLFQTLIVNTQWHKRLQEETKLPSRRKSPRTIPTHLFIPDFFFFPWKSLTSFMKLFRVLTFSAQRDQKHNIGITYIHTKQLNKVFTNETETMKKKVSRTWTITLFDKMYRIKDKTKN